MLMVLIHQHFISKHLLSSWAFTFKFIVVKVVYLFKGKLLSSCAPSLWGICQWFLPLLQKLRNSSCWLFHLLKLRTCSLLALAFTKVAHLPFSSFSKLYASWLVSRLVHWLQFISLVVYLSNSSFVIVDIVIYIHIVYLSLFYFIL